MTETTAAAGARKKALTGQTLRIYWHHAQIYWPTLIVCAVSVIIVIGCDIVAPLIYKQFFDQLAIDPIHEATRSKVGEIYHTILLIALVSALSWVGWRVCNLGIMKLESRVMKDLSDFCYAYLQNHSYKFFTDNFAGALVKRVNRFAAGFEVVADQCTFDMGQTIIRIILIIGVLFSRNTMLGSVFLAWTAIFVIFNFLFARWKMKIDLVRAELDTKVTARLADTIANAVNLKLFASIGREVSQFRDLTGKHQGVRYASWKLGWYSDTIQGGSTRALEIVVLVVAVRAWLLGSLTLGDFVLIRSYLAQLTENVRTMSNNIRRIYETMADANEMTEILLMPHDVVDDEQAAMLTVPKGIVEFRHVQFSYGRGAKMVLQDVTFRTRPGERVGIVGPSGGGKSTMLKLLARLYAVGDGAILIDHQNTALVTQESLHQNIAYVPQDPMLFHRTLMENIRYAKPEATEAEVIQAAKAAHCHEFISGFPKGYETLVGEHGVKLSGGERQRVAIARAILMNAPILVLDEATSSLDSESEMYIQDSLTKLFVGRTVIAIAHRLSTIRKMNRIMVVQDGRIIEEGDHDLLVRIENGVYQRLWNIQSTNLAPDKSKDGEYLQ